MTEWIKAAVVAKRGPALFQLEDIALPAPGPGQILIKVESAGVNFSDVKRRRGDAYPFETTFPFIPGGRSLAPWQGWAQALKGRLSELGSLLCQAQMDMEATLNLPLRLRKLHIPYRNL